MDNERLKKIRERKKLRQRKQIIKIGAIVAGFTFCAYMIISGVNSVVTSVKQAIPTPSPTPVAIISAENIPYDNPNLKPAKLPTPKENNNITEFIESTNSENKVCYLTFDDGPNKSVTPLILDILRRYNIKATFFQVGTLIEENIDISKRVYEEGHLIGNHSYDHTYNKLYANHQSFMEEFNKCAELIKEVTGDDYFPVMRLPGGSYRTGTYGDIKQELKVLLAENDIYHCDWNALSGDAEGSPKTKEQLLERIKSSSKGKNKIVVLMHDASSKKQTAEALPAIIEYLISENYHFSRLDEPMY